MRGWMIVASCTLPFAALAQSGDAAGTPAPADSAAGFGSQTRLWLATQTGGEYAVSEARPMPGEVATLVYQRYLKSFTHPIPERYESNSFKTSAGDSGGGGGGN